MFYLPQFYGKIYFAYKCMGEKMRKGKKIFMTFLLLIIILFTIRLYIDHNFIKKTSYEVKSTKIPSTFEGYKILQITDLHNKDFGKMLTDMIEKENPDIIVLTGDMVSANHINYTTFLDFAKYISSKYKVYYIKGNHEGELLNKNYSVIVDALDLYGVKILDNEMIKLEKEGDYINLYGMWCNQRYYSRADEDKTYVVKEETVEKLLGKPNVDEYNILLMHTPAYFEAYEHWGADLVISGHMHGGLIRLPYLGGVFSPDRKLFPKYCYGRFDKNLSTMIISSGLSRGETGFRLFNRPEIVTITLKSQNLYIQY